MSGKTRQPPKLMLVKALSCRVLFLSHGINSRITMSPFDFILNNLAYPSGILISFYTSQRYKLIILLVLLITVFYVISEVAFYFVNISNLNEATACLSTMAFTTTAFIRLLLILYNNRQLKDLILCIRRISKRRPNISYITNAAERQSKRFAITFVFFVYLTLFLMSVTPLGNMYLEFRATGEVRKTRYELPFKLL